MDKVLLKKQLASVGRVAVLAGGNSAERPVSLKSGAAVHQALRNLGLIAGTQERGYPERV